MATKEKCPFVLCSLCPDGGRCLAYNRYNLSLSDLSMNVWVCWTAAHNTPTIMMNNTEIFHFTNIQVELMRFILSNSYFITRMCISAVPVWCCTPNDDWKRIARCDTTDTDTHEEEDASNDPNDYNWTGTVTLKMSDNVSRMVVKPISLFHWRQPVLVSTLLQCNVTWSRWWLLWLRSGSDLWLCDYILVTIVLQESQLSSTGANNQRHI